MPAPSEKYAPQHRRTTSTTSLNSDIYMNSDVDDNDSNSLINSLVTAPEEYSPDEPSEIMQPPYSVLPGTFPEASESSSILELTPQFKSESSLSQNLGIRRDNHEYRSMQKPKFREGECVVCRQDIVEIIPAGVNYHQPKTCGQKCVQSLQAVSVIPSSVLMRGQLANPHTSRFGFFNNILRANKVQIAMCEVCSLRPKCQRGGKTYPTCGLTCAAKLQSSRKGAIDMCDHCKKRPKLSISGKIYPHCGRTCRDKALIAEKLAVAAANSATCSTCLVCWIGVPVKESKSDICSEECRLGLKNRTPLLIEVPRGHRAFKKVEDFYGENWKQSKASVNSPRIKKIYMVQMKETSTLEHEAYLSSVVSNWSPKKTSDSRRHAWIGIGRTSSCGFGDPGNMEPCRSRQCFLCSIVRSDFDKEIFDKGITSTLSLPRAVDRTFRSTTSSKLVLLADVVLGKIAEDDGVLNSQPRKGYNSVHRVEYDKLGGKVDYQEYVVFEGVAVRPLYLMTLE